MKKSEIYRQAQCAVIAVTFISVEEKLDILHELFNQEDLAKFCEEHERA